MLQVRILALLVAVLQLARGHSSPQAILIVLVLIPIPVGPRPSVTIRSPDTLLPPNGTHHCHHQVVFQRHFSREGCVFDSILRYGFWFEINLDSMLEF